ncbi:TatD family hydrolase [Thalassotalea mangrovi]|uniref:TatD family deoxyribonuclease n=1 Tax=Thalassotalea mangrovi TaxID=2572245 RepID=A0A4U1B3L0_9GAMM|nr:TatD family hydrolase [Thalassotalea mangrovi]TKB44531.1 TatD family deoxyribonuclease [Thalassotalea mangrovi]
MLFTDSHCHFDFPEFSGLRTDIARQIRELGVHRIIVPGVSAAHWQRQFDTCRQFAPCYFAFGIHPWWVEDAKEEDLTLLPDYLLHNKVIAVGEIGLDAKIDNMAKQQEFFQAQLAIARSADLPVLIHHRRTHHLIQPLLKQYALPRGGVIHAYSGSFQQAMTYVELGFKLGVGGTITYERAQKTRDAIARVPLTSLLLETDAPAMPLAGRQGEINSPAYLPEVFRQLCQLRSEPEDLIAHQLEQNCQQLFSF